MPSRQPPAPGAAATPTAAPMATPAIEAHVRRRPGRVPSWQETLLTMQRLKHTVEAAVRDGSRPATAVYRFYEHMRSLPPQEAARYQALFAVCIEAYRRFVARGKR